MNKETIKQYTKITSTVEALRLAEAGEQDRKAEAERIEREVKEKADQVEREKKEASE